MQTATALTTGVDNDENVSKIEQVPLESDTRIFIEHARVDTVDACAGLVRHAFKVTIEALTAGGAETLADLILTLPKTYAWTTGDPYKIAVYEGSYRKFQTTYRIPLMIDTYWKV